MDHSKLFRVLVIGGAVLGAGCFETAPPVEVADDAGRSPDAGPVDRGEVDAGEVDASVAAPADAAVDAPLMECGICPNEECCETDESGASHTRPGLVCCWGTSC